MDAVRVVTAMATTARADVAPAAPVGAARVVAAVAAEDKEAVSY